MRRISSWATSFQLIYPPGAGLFLIILALLVASWFGSSGAWSLASIGIAFVVVLLLTGPRAHHIFIDKGNIHIAGLFRHEKVPLSHIQRIVEYPSTGYHWATIEFSEATRFGKSVHFIPAIEYRRDGLLVVKRVAPVVQELAESSGAKYERVQ